VTILNWVVSENFVVAEETFTGVATPGHPAQHVTGVVYEFRDGRISGQIWLQ
jgi:ketosteroid isomerase-like protein